jgi:hypothetical protein
MNFPFTQTEINYLKDIQPNYKVELTNKWRYYYFERFIDIYDYINTIDNGSTYVIIPMLSYSRELTDVKLILSLPFLINNNSNKELITKFLLDQWKSSVFTVSGAQTLEITFKVKRAYIFRK